MKFSYQAGSQPLDGITIKRAIHRGGFGEVYHAQSAAGKELAIKLLHDNMEVELRGVRQCLNLSHPQLVTIFDIKSDADGDHWILMEYVPGPTLAEVIADHRSGMPVETVKEILGQCHAGIGFLHDRGLIHRDLKPANLFWDGTHLKIGDIGLSKFITVSQRSAHTQSVGTVYYMAPEVARGRYGPGVDIYALGVITYELLTGDVPFDGETTAEILMKHLTQQPDLDRIPAPLRPVIGRALAKDEQERYQSVDEFYQDFLAGVEGRKSSAKAHVPADGFTIPYGKQDRKSTPESFQTAHASAKTRPEWETSQASRNLAPAGGHKSGSGFFWVLLLGIPLMLWFSVRMTFAMTFVVGVFFALSYVLLRRSRQMWNEAFENTSPAPPVARVSATTPPSMHRGQSLRVTSPGSFWKGIALVPVYALTMAGAILFFSRNFFASEWSPQGYDLGHMTFFVAVTVLASWAGLGAVQICRRVKDLPMGRRSILAVTGLLIGLGASQLDHWFMVDYPNSIYPNKRNGIMTLGRHELAVPSHPGLDVITPVTRELTEDSRILKTIPVSHSVGSEDAAPASAETSPDLSTWTPTAMCYAIFFALLLGGRDWNRVTSPLRSHRLQIFELLVSIGLAYLICVMFPFPIVWGMTWGTAITAAIQLASPSGKTASLVRGVQ